MQEDQAKDNSTLLPVPYQAAKRAAFMWIILYQKDYACDGAIREGDLALKLVKQATGNSELSPN